MRRKMMEIPEGDSPISDWAKASVSDGKIIFTNVTLSNKRFWVKSPVEFFTGYYSDIYTTNAYDDVTLTLTTDSPVISTNYSSIIQCELSEPIEGVKVTVGETEILTDENGIAKYTINGESNGDILVIGNIYGASDSILIEDVIQYWSKSDAKLLNREWDIRSGVINSATGGWRCSPASNNYFVMNLSLCKFNHSLELIVKSASAVDYIRYCGMWVAQTSLKAGDVIRFDYNYDDEIVSFYKNNVLTSTTSIPKDTLVSWGFRTTSSTGYVIFDKLKLKRIE